MCHYNQIYCPFIPLLFVMRRFFERALNRIFPYYELRPAPLLFGVTRPFETSPSFRYTALGFLEFLRISRLITPLIGPQYRRSRTLIEIDLTYFCNLKCSNCNRSCSQAPSREYITLNQIQDFIDASMKEGVRWKRIRLLGGEPTLHPHFPEVVKMILGYKENYSPKTKIEVATNGYGTFVNKMLSSLPEGIEIINTEKIDSTPYFFSL